MKHHPIHEPANTSPTVFPLGKTGGLIEAIRSALATVSTARCFRWVKTGGLIEARITLLNVSVRDVVRFRWVKPAASLKLR